MPKFIKAYFEIRLVKLGFWESEIWQVAKSLGFWQIANIMHEFTKAYFEIRLIKFWQAIGKRFARISRNVPKNFFRALRARCIELDKRQLWPKKSRALRAMH